jgi:hypothetical protein
MSSNIEYIGGDELVFTSDDVGRIYSGGFSVNSIMMKQGFSPITTINSEQVGGDKVSDLFNNLVVPNWALSYSYPGIFTGGAQKIDEYECDSEDECISDELYTSLIDLVKEKNPKILKKRLTRRYKPRKTGSRKATMA